MHTCEYTQKLGIGIEGSSRPYTLLQEDHNNVPYVTIMGLRGQVFHAGILLLQDQNFLRVVRRWPPLMVDRMASFLELRSNTVEPIV